MEGQTTADNQHPQNYNTPWPDLSPTRTLLRSPAAYRSQLKEEFVEIFGPSERSSMDFMYSQFLCEELLSPEGPSMEAALDTLYLLHMAARHNDESMAREGSRMRLRALQRVSLDMQNPEAIYDDGMVGAMWILSFCDNFQCLLDISVDARIHQEAVGRVLIARGARGVNSRLAKRLWFNIQSTGFSFGMAKRKPVVALPFRECWHDFTSRRSLPKELVEILSLIPTLLERVDQQRYDDLNSWYTTPLLLTDLTELEARLSTWYVGWLRVMDAEPYRMATFRESPHFAVYLEEVANPFTKALQFSSFSTASLQITYWTGMLQLKSALMDLMSMQDCEMLRTLRWVTVKAEAQECADLLSQSVAFVTAPSHGYCGMLRAMAPLYFAAKWFEQHHWEDKALWCVSISRQTQQAYGMLSPYRML